MELAETAVAEASLVAIDVLSTVIEIFPLVGKTDRFIKSED
jgi:hypothetical protein